MPEDYADLVKEIYRRVNEMQKVLDELGVGRPSPKDQPATQEPNSIDFATNEIYKALKSLSEPLASSYAQIKIDLADNTRISWAGTAHEIRQLVSTMLQLLAPDAEVIVQKGYKQEPNTSGPTQKQRAIYILEKYKSSSREKDVVAKISKFEEIISELVRDFYSRASDAAHTRRDKTETKRLLNYFEAFAHDLLDLK